VSKLTVPRRIYLDAFLQNIKSVTFFTFLPVLIARLGASDLEIALSNSLPNITAAICLAFLTRQLPVNRGVFLLGGYIRQFAFLGMALSILLPNPIPVILCFWALNGAAIMVVASQQPAIMRMWISTAEFSKIFSMNKIISIVVTTIGSFLIGMSLDATNQFFPLNFSMSMLIGCLSTFTGMALIAQLAPVKKTKLILTFVKPFQESDRLMWWMGLNTAGIAMVGPLFTIYHVNTLQFSNTQIAYFVITTGIVSAVVMPFVSRWIERFGVLKIYGTAILIMALTIFPYGFVDRFWLLVILQSCIGMSLAVSEVTTSFFMMKNAGNHRSEMSYFSDFHLIMSIGTGAGALLAGFLLLVFPLSTCFIIIAVLRIIFIFSIRTIRTTSAPTKKKIEQVEEKTE
jgi:hypothetical protein